MKLVDAYVVEDIRDLRVKFDSNSQRVMVDFKSLLNYDDAEDVFELVPGEVRLEVYKAAKLGKLQQNIEIQIMADKRTEEIYNAVKQYRTWKLQRVEWHKKAFKASRHCIYPKKDGKGGRRRVT